MKWEGRACLVKGSKVKSKEARTMSFGGPTHRSPGVDSILCCIVLLHFNKFLDGACMVQFTRGTQLSSTVFSTPPLISSSSSFFSILLFYYSSSSFFFSSSSPIPFLLLLLPSSLSFLLLHPFTSLSLPFPSLRASLALKGI